jgi:hypothetical protein
MATILLLLLLSLPFVLLLLLLPWQLLQLWLQGYPERQLLQAYRQAAQHPYSSPVASSRSEQSS